jgi:hypothetical protein
VTESWIVEKGVRKGKPYAKRHHLHVPIDLATGHLERLSDLAVREAIKDLQAEQERRRVPEVEPIALPTSRPRRAPRAHDPMQSQFRGDTE